MRTHYCAEINEEHISEEVTVAGWVASRRDHGGVIFIDLRDKDQVIQLVCDPADNAEAHKQAEDIRDQFVVIATGKIRARGEGLENPNLKTGKVEMVVDKLVIENRSKPMPFELNDEKVNEEIKLKYRYLELRTQKSYDIFKLRSKATSLQSLHQKVQETTLYQVVYTVVSSMHFHSLHNFLNNFLWLVVLTNISRSLNVLEMKI